MRCRQINDYGVYIAVVSYMCLWLACSKDGSNEVYVPKDEITASDISLVPDKETKVVTAVLSFDDLDAIAHLVVKKSGADDYAIRIDHAALSPSYALTYRIQPSDPEAFKLVLTAHYHDGNVSNPLFLTIDNRWGFFIRGVDRLARVTGRPLTGEVFPSPNHTATAWNVGGTDLGVVWEMEPGTYGIFFGDTFGHDFTANPANPGPNGGSWRSNVLAFSTDDQLDDGLSISSMVADNSGNAREIIYGGKDQSGNGDWTSIPTAAIRINGVDYVHYFNIRSWTGWVTNYSGMYKSVDNGQTWAKCEDVLFSSNSNFGQAGYFKKGGYVYMIGTRTGRDSPAHLARFRESEIEHIANYEYWNSNAGQWIRGEENRATVVIDDQVGELSFLYNDTHKKWLIAYFNADRYNITLRMAEEITGPWSEPFELVGGEEYPQLYGSYFHPLSTTGDNLYFLMSMWMPYNVFLMSAELADMGPAPSVHASK